MRYYTYFYIALFLFMFCIAKGDSFKTLIREDFYISHDFTNEGIFTEGCEGPAVDIMGNLYAVNLTRNGTIAIVDTVGNARIFTSLPAGCIGNGIRFDRFDNMYIADYAGHNLFMIPAGKTRAEIYTHQPEFHQPNDLAIMSNGIIFASDPDWKNQKGKLWRIGTDKVAVLLDATMGTTNGIEVSPDEKHLYVNESAQLKIWKFDLNEIGEISNKTLFASFTDFGLDGMRCDAEGNLYVTRYGKGVVSIFSSEGILLREVLLKGKEVSNIAFGGKDGRTCYVTLADRKMIETFRTETPGREWNLSHPTLSETQRIPDSRIAVFPNPTHSHITLSNLIPHSLINVTDMDGKVLVSLKTTTENEQIDMKSWRNGIYIIHIQSNGRWYVKKIMKY